jgi:hypothetical protein
MKPIGLIATQFAIILLSFIFLAGFTINPQTVRQKADLAIAKLKVAIAEGHDISSIVPKMKKVKVLGQSGKLDAANRLLDRILNDFTALSGNNIRHKSRSKISDILGSSDLISIVGFNKDAMEPFVSRDGRYLFFNDFTKSNPHKDIHWATRLSARKFQYRGRVKNVNSNQVDGVPSMDIHGNFYFISTKKYNWFNGFNTVYSGKFDPKTGTVNYIKPHPELSLRKAGWLNMDVEISADGQTLYSTQSYFPKGAKSPTKSYFFYAKKQGRKFVLQKNSNRIFRRINKDGDLSGDGIVYAASISKDQRTLFFTKASTSSSGMPVFRSYIAKRHHKNAVFGDPSVIRAITGFSEAPTISADEQKLYYHKQLTLAAGEKPERRFHILQIKKKYWRLLGSSRK